MVHKEDCEASNFMIYGFDYIIPILLTLAVLALMPLIYKYIKAYYKNELGTRTSLVCDSIMFILIILTLIFNTMHSFHRCHDQKSIAYILSLAGFFTYPLQGMMLSVMLFMKLAIHFKDTHFRLSRCHIIAYIGLVILGIAATVSGTILVKLQHDESLHREPHESQCGRGRGWCRRHTPHCL